MFHTVVKSASTSSECRVTRDRFAEDERVNVLITAPRSANEHAQAVDEPAHMCSLVSVNNLQVRGMSSNMVPMKIGQVSSRMP
jgi:hypothetical protein